MMYRFDFIMDTTVWEQFKNKMLKINFNCEEPVLVRYVPSPFLYAEEAAFITDNPADRRIIERLIRDYSTNELQCTLIISK